MRPGIIVKVNAADCAWLEPIMADGNSAQKHVWRAVMVLATADWFSTNAVASQIGKSKTAVLRWQERLA